MGRTEECYGSGLATQPLTARLSLTQAFRDGFLAKEREVEVRVQPQGREGKRANRAVIGSVFFGDGLLNRDPTWQGYEATWAGQP